MKSKFNNPFIKLLCAAAMLAVAGASQVSATTLSFGDSNDLGLIDPNHPADPTSSGGYIDILLSQPLSSGPTTVGPNQYTRTGNDPLSGSYPAAVFNVDLMSSTTINLGSGYLYLLGKYDGPNYGSEVWYVGGLTGTITIPGTAGQYGLSHVYLFNGSGGVGLPDGGSTLAMLGIAMSGLGLLKRKLLAS
jgi:hypothetical protein